MSELQPPDHYRAEERAIWTSITREALALGITANLNPDILNALVIHIKNHREATQAVAEEGAILPDGKEHSALRIANAEERAVIRLRRELHLGTPRKSQGGPKGGVARWCEKHNRAECYGHKRTDGGQCHAIAAIGLAYCGLHAGVKLENDPAHIAAVLRAENPLDGEPMDITPGQALLWRVRVLAGEVRRLDAKIATIEADDLVFGTTIEEEGGEHTYAKTTRAARINMWLILRSERETMLQRACEGALRAGIEQQLVDLEREQITMVHQVILMALDRIGGISADDPRIREHLPAIIAELTA